MTALTDLIDRLNRAATSIDGLASSALDGTTDGTVRLVRLTGKAEGVRLALSYAEEDRGRDAEMVADMRRALGLAESVKRIDPAGCGCTDCLTGYSEAYIPFADKHVIAMRYGWVEDAT